MRTLVHLLLLSAPAWAATLAVDFGADWTKASIVGPKMEILLNTDSKRKFQSVVGWKGSERVFGSDSFSVAARFPADTFLSLKYVLGALFDSPRTQYFSSIYGVKTYATPRGTVGLQRSDGTQWSVEELVAMQFAYIKQVADSAGGDPVRDVVVTVPPYYSQVERQAISDAIEIAGLRPLGLINDGAAIAVNYAMTRSFATPEHHIFYNAGASSTSATLVTFSSVINNTTKSEGTLIEVRGVGYDAILGGTEFDRRLREILAERFISKYGRDVREEPKAMSKLWKEAGRVKTILSVNNETSANIESLAWDLDLRTKVTRAELEDACADLTPRFAQPLTEALAQAKLFLDDITSVVFVGGASRVPMVQAAVISVVGSAKIARNVNADEAAAVGASLYAATLSRHFRTKDIRVQDMSVHNIQVVYTSEAKNDPTKTRTIHNVLFPRGGKTGSKKTLTLKRKDDFKIALEYKDNFPTPSQIVEASIDGVSEAIGNLTESGAIDPAVKITLSLSDDAFVSVDQAIAHGEIKDDTLTGMLKGFFAGSTSIATSELSEESSTRIEMTDAVSAETTNSATPSPSVTAEVKVKPKDTYELKITLNHVALRPLTSSEKAESKSRLRSLDTEESNKRLNSETRNILEAYIYRLRDLLDGSAESPFFEFSTEAERTKLQTTLGEVSVWMQKSGDNASTSELNTHKKKLEVIEEPIQTRNREFHAAPAAIRDLQQALLAGHTFVSSARENRTMEEGVGFEPKYSVEEIDGVERTINETSKWLEENVANQDKRKRNEDPVLRSKDVESRGKLLQAQVMRLLKRKWIPKLKKTATTSVASETSSSTSTTATESRTTGHAPEDL